MNFLASHWYVWLILWALSFVYIVWNQISRIRRMSSFMRNDGYEKDYSYNSFSKGLIGFAIGGMFVVVTGVLSILSVIGYFLMKING
jgi:hypothetical protein